MRERPILFSGPLVRAILSGAKSQTRRPAKLLNVESVSPNFDGTWSVRHGLGGGTALIVSHGCPFGVVGDRLWVRETWRSWGESCRNEQHEDDHACSAHCEQTYVAYAATPRVGYRPKPDCARITYLHESTPIERNPDLLGPWKPSIHMPRWASRLLLDVTDVRLERLCDIGEADAIAEGIAPNPVQEGTWIDYPEGTSAAGWRDPRQSFRSLWDSLYSGELAWAANPYVWAVSFKRIDKEGRAA